MAMAMLGINIGLWRSTFIFLSIRPQSSVTPVSVSAKNSNINRRFYHFGSKTAPDAQELGHSSSFYLVMRQHFWHIESICANRKNIRQI
jgi:hypothetical protein